MRRCNRSARRFWWARLRCVEHVVGGAEILVVSPPQQAVEVKPVAQDEVEVVGCVVVKCFVVWCFVC